MKKKGLLICFVIIVMLVTGCGSKTTVPPLELPDTEEITAVKVIISVLPHAHSRTKP